MQRIGLRGKLFLSLIAVVAVCATVAAIFTYRAFESVLLDIKDAHFRFVVNDVSTSVTNLTALGLPLSALHRSQDIIEKVRTRDAEIGSIVIFGQNGDILYSTDLGEIGSNVPPDWLAAAKTNADGQSPPLAGGMVTVAALGSTFGDFAGGVALRSGATGLPLQLEEGAMVLAGLVLASLLVAGAVAWCCIQLLFGPLANGLKRGAGHLEAVVNGRQAPSLAKPAWFRPAFERYVARVRRSLKLLSRGMSTAARIDEHG